MSLFPDIQNQYPPLKEWAILIGYCGSMAHGMYISGSHPNSIDDKDIMAVCIPPLDYYFGLKQFGSRGTQIIKKDEWDIVVYELKKFVSLLKKGNPNVISLLWLDEALLIHETEEGKLLRCNKNLFVGKHIYFSFAGYAQSQLYKMEHLACKGYMGEKRKRLVGQFGYDTKNAAHLIRLLRMAIEFLNEGVFLVKRPDREELLAIKKGEWKLAEVKKEAQRLFQKAEAAYRHSTLPDQPDEEQIHQLCMEILKMRFGCKTL